ncbi:MAG: DUF4838 domain-containing protein [Clostridia bacterium]|nr:DUF4838 domain-containing protein [Clostridia bacterium]
MKNNAIKKLFALALSALTAFSFVACGGEASSSQDNSSSESVEQEESTFADTNVSLAENRTTAYKIVISGEASTAMVYAANEMQRYIEYSTGAKMEIVKDSTIQSATSADYYISIDRTDLLQNCDVTFEFSELGRDGYKIVRRDNTVYICGGKETGSAFGVYEFLEHQIGYQCYTYDEIDYDTYETLKLKDFGTYVDTPDFAERYMDGMMRVGESDTAWRHRFVDEYGTYDYYTNLGTKTWVGNSGHSLTHFRQSLPKEPVGWFSTNEQPCLTNTDLQQAFADWLITQLKAKPDAYIVGLGHEDSHLAWCKCAPCQQEAGTYKSGYYVRFCNKIIQIIEAWREENCPEREWIYSMFAYSLTTNAPVIENEDGSFSVIDESCKMHEKLYIRLAPSGMCYGHDLYDVNCTINVSTSRSMKTWLALTNNVMVWTYTACYGLYLPFFNNFDTIQSNLRDFKDMGTTNLFIEENSGNNLTSFGYLRCYLYGKLSWDTELNVSELIDNFFINYYKEAEPYMRELFNLYRTYFAAMNVDSDNKLHWKATYVLSDRFSRNLIEQALDILDQAMAVCDKVEDEETAQKLRNRILAESICIRWVKLAAYEDYGYDMSEFDALLAEFERDVIALDVRRVAEATSMADWLASLKK